VSKSSSKRRRSLPFIAAGKQLAVALGAVALLGSASCTPDIAIRGNLPRPEKLAEIKPGSTTQNQVRELLGPPSNVGTFDSKVWYYISQKTEDVPMNVPQVLDRTVVVVRFDGKGVVQDLKTLDKSAGRDITPVAETTPTAGHEPNLFQDLFGNIGRVGAAETTSPGY
jgi:outer membrane protein assembly factor BamE (lipoprotein component of BamABCDE complex)